MKALVLILAASAVIGVASGASAQVGPFERSGTQQEVEHGREALADLQQKGLLSKEPVACNRLGRIMARLNAAMPDRLFTYQGGIVAENTVNAFSFGGGYIFMCQGLLTLLDTDEELAFIMAHEMGHAALRHSGKQMRKARSVIIAQIVLAIASKGQANSTLGALGQAAMASYSREDERAADAFAVDLYLAAGFDASKVATAMELIQKSEEKKGGGSGGYLSSHPKTSSRIEAIRKRATESESAVGKTSPAPTPSAAVDLSKLYGAIPVPKLEPSVWYPLAPGLEWRYQVAGAAGSSVYTVKVESVLEAPQGSVYRLSTDMGTGSVVYWQSLTTATQVWRRNRPQEESSTWRAEFSISPEPATLDEWAFAGATAEAVSTPAGDFSDAVKVVATNSTKNRTLHLWFAKGVGLVKRQDPASGVTEVLVSLRK